MVKKVEEYRDSLVHHKAHRLFLLNHSGLPDKRVNLELAKAFAQTASRQIINDYAALTAEEAPKDTSEEFLSFCGVLGLGRLAMEGKDNALQKLKRMASDPRWRIREAVAMALQMIGLFDMDWLIAIASKWVKGNYYEQRAAIAGLCEADLLWDERHADDLFKILTTTTKNIADSEDRGSDGFRVLKKGLGYCWSVAVAAYPEQGKAAMEKWIQSQNRDIRWIMKQNLNKKRLRTMNPEWVSKMQDKLNSPPLVMKDN